MKNKVFNYFSNIAIFATLIVVLLSCNKDESPIIPEDEFIDSVSTNSINDPADAIQRISFLYEQILFRWGFYWITANQLAGVTQEREQGYEFGELENFSYNSESMEVERIWTDCYKSIHLADLYISEVDDNPGSAAATDAYLGQAHFYRALAYYTLVRMYGKYYPERTMSASGVPIISINSFTDLSRASVEEVYNYIIDDLEIAEALLSDQTGTEITSKYAVMSLAANTHMWFREFDKAELVLAEIIQSGNFSLVDVFSYNFDGYNENSTESIFEFQFYWDGSVWYTYDYYYLPAHRYSYKIGGDESRQFMLTDMAVDMIGNDPRANETYYKDNADMYYNGAILTNSLAYPYIKKYAHIDQNIGSQGCGNNLILFRLADIYLLYSEIQIIQNNLDEAITYMNLVRERVDVNPIVSGTLSSEELMEVLMLDRFKELCGEGSYWYDLIRWDKAGTELTARGFIKGMHEAFPIPLEILENNDGILQNAGY